LDERAVRVDEPLRQAHGAVDELGTHPIAHALKWRQNGCGEFASTGDDLGAVMGRELAAGGAGDDVEPESLAVEEGVIGYGRLVRGVGGHGYSLNIETKGTETHHRRN